MRYFTSDPHYFHNNIIRYCSRPFKDTNEMERVLIERYNSVVKPEDTCYWVGDSGFWRQPDQIGRILKRLNGTKVLILGNHDDKFGPFTFVDQGFVSVHTSLIIHDLGIVLNHDPSVHCCIPSSMALICGHIHGLFRHVRNDSGLNVINVGVDVWDFTPVSEEKILEILSSGTQEKWNGEDPHHSENWKAKEKKPANIVGAIDVESSGVSKDPQS